MCGTVEIEVSAEIGWVIEKKCGHCLCSQVMVNFPSNVELYCSVHVYNIHVHVDLGGKGSAPQYIHLTTWIC